MSLTASTMLLPLGATAPDFRLPDPDGRMVALDDLGDAPALLVVFMCNHCPYVKHIRAGLARLARDYQAKGVAVVGINANDAAAYPDDSPERMREEAQQAGYSFPYLFDETQEVAKAYRAACTPDFYVFDRHRRLAYRGQMDDSRPNSGRPVTLDTPHGSAVLERESVRGASRVTGQDLRAALDAVLGARPVHPDQKPSAGCNIKWKPGNEPEY